MPSEEDFFARLCAGAAPMVLRVARARVIGEVELPQGLPAPGRARDEHARRRIGEHSPSASVDDLLTRGHVTSQVVPARNRLRAPQPSAPSPVRRSHWGGPGAVEVAHRIDQPPGSGSRDVQASWGRGGEGMRMSAAADRIDILDEGTFHRLGRSAHRSPQPDRPRACPRVRRDGRLLDGDSRVEDPTISHRRPRRAHVGDRGPLSRSAGDSQPADPVASPQLTGFGKMGCERLPLVDAPR